MIIGGYYLYKKYNKNKNGEKEQYQEWLTPASRLHHQSAPLSSLKDPASFGPPPRRTVRTEAQSQMIEHDPSTGNVSVLEAHVVQEIPDENKAVEQEPPGMAPTTSRPEAKRIGPPPPVRADRRTPVESPTVAPAIPQRSPLRPEVPPHRVKPQNPPKIVRPSAMVVQASVRASSVRLPNRSVRGVDEPQSTAAGGLVRRRSSFESHLSSATRVTETPKARFNEPQASSSTEEDEGAMTFAQRRALFEATMTSGNDLVPAPLKPKVAEPAHAEVMSRPSSVWKAQESTTSSSSAASAFPRKKKAPPPPPPKRIAGGLARHDSVLK